MLRADRIRLALLAGCVAFAAQPVFVSAGNSVHPRTPVVWSPAACVEVVDRSVDPVLRLEYGVPVDDTEIGVDELPDSRRHQFLAFDQHWAATEPLPRYISEADLQRALDAMLQDPEQLPAEPVVETHPQWGDALVRITPDDMRVPITAEQAAMGVQWDTTGLTPGAYFVAGYTWEPPLNLWSPRSGVVLVVDGLDDASPPAVAMTVAETTVEAIASVGEPYELRACVRASSGSTATFEVRSEGSADWVALDELPVEGAELRGSFEATDAMAGSSVDLRVRVEDPMGRSVVAYTRRAIQVTSGGGGGGDEGGSATAGESSTEGGDAETGEGGGAGATGCRMASPEDGEPAWLVFALAGLGRRRRGARGRARSRQK